MSLQHLHAPNVTTTMCPACQNEGKQWTDRATRGFSDDDIWSFDVYLAKLIANGLTVLRGNLHGCPPELCSDDDKTWADEGVARWQGILDDIIAGFQGYVDSDGTEEGKDYSRSEQFQRSFDLLRQWWPHLWD